MAGQSRQAEQGEQGVNMTIPVAQPNIQAEEWALRAIERTDLDQVVLRMTEVQLRTFDQVISDMSNLSDDNEFWARRPAAMEAMFNEMDNVYDNIMRAQNLVADETLRRDDVAERLNLEESVQQGYINQGDSLAAADHRFEVLNDLRTEMEALREPELSPNERMVATALLGNRE